MKFTTITFTQKRGGGGEPNHCSVDFFANIFHLFNWQLQMTIQYTVVPPVDVS